MQKNLVRSNMIENMITTKKRAIKLIKKADKYLELARWEEAEKLLQEAISLDAGNPEAYYLLGETLCKQERFLESIEALIKADKLLPDNPRILHLLGWANFMKGNPDVGRKFMSKAHQILPKDIQILCDLAVLENKEGNEEKAKKFISKALEIDSTNQTAQGVYKAILFFNQLRSEYKKKIN